MSMKQRNLEKIQSRLFLNLTPIISKQIHLHNSFLCFFDLTNKHASVLYKISLRLEENNLCRMGLNHSSWSQTNISSFKVGDVEISTGQTADRSCISVCWSESSACNAACCCYVLRICPSLCISKYASNTNCAIWSVCYAAGAYVQELLQKSS